jgi:glyoxylase-like metal-dependent hydrolase (beta-lactamase superfamily II)
MSRLACTSLVAPRLMVGWISALVSFGFVGSAERVYTQDAQARAGQSARAAWRPTLPSANDGEVHVLPVRGNIHMLVGAGANITVHVGDEGVLLVDTGLASRSDKVLAAVRTISRRPLRYIVNTNERDDHVGGNAAIAAQGENIPLRLLDSVGGAQSGGGSGPAAIFSNDRASVISFLTVFNRMAAPAGQVPPTPEAGWPDNTYSTPQKKLYFNDEPILIMHQPGTTDGNSIVLFRKADVVSAGDLIDLTRFPRIDLEAGGSVQALVHSLNDILNITIPDRKSEGGTMVIPGYGRLADIADVTYYRDMVYIIRDRVQDMLKRGMTLEQVKAARPTREYDPRYGRETGAWTTDMFVEAVYRSLGK